MQNIEVDLGDDLEITRIDRRRSAGGALVDGQLNGHRFQALIYPKHAECLAWEIDGSLISKLWIQRMADDHVVYNWDRGADVPARTPEAQAIVDFLAAGLTEFIYTALTTKDDLFTQIAREHLYIETLEERRRDHLDFHDVGVVGVQRALAAAYRAGQAELLAAAEALLAAEIPVAKDLPASTKAAFKSLRSAVKNARSNA